MRVIMRSQNNLLEMLAFKEVGIVHLETTRGTFLIFESHDGNICVCTDNKTTATSVTHKVICIVEER